MQPNKKILVGIATNGVGGVDSYIASFVRVAAGEGIKCDVLTTKYDASFAAKLGEFGAKLVPIANLHDKPAIRQTFHNLCHLDAGNVPYIGAYMNISTDVMYPYVKECAQAKIPNIVVHGHAHYNSQPT